MRKKYWTFGMVIFSISIFVLLCLNYAESQSDLVKRDNISSMRLALAVSVTHRVRVRKWI